MGANKICQDQCVRVWIWEARSKLHSLCLRQPKGSTFENYLDIELESLRETMIQSWSGGWMDDPEDLNSFRDCMDALTTLRFSDPFETRWIETALPPWSEKKVMVFMWTKRNVHTILGVLDFLDTVTTHIPGKSLDWLRVRQWVLECWDELETGYMSKMD